MQIVFETPSHSEKHGLANLAPETHSVRLDPFQLDCTAIEHDLQLPFGRRLYERLYGFLDVAEIEVKGARHSAPETLRGPAGRVFERAKTDPGCLQGKRCCQQGLSGTELPLTIVGLLFSS